LPDAEITDLSLPPKPLAEDCIAFLLAEGFLDTHDALTLARKLASDRARRMAESLERMVKSEEEAQAADDAERSADVDAQGRPRVSFDLAYLKAGFRTGTFPNRTRR